MKVFLVTAEAPNWKRYVARKSEALVYARKASLEDPGNPIEVSLVGVRTDLPKMELIARCLSRDNWGAGGSELIARFLGGKRVKDEAPVEEIAA